MKSFVAPHIERLAPYVPGKPVEELERELGIAGAVKLASNENPMGPSPKAIAAAAKALAGSNRYPDAAGFALRSALAAHHGITMDELCLGNGSNEIIDLLCRTLASPLDHGVTGVPSFVCYPLAFTAANVPFTAVPLREQVFFNADDLLAAVVPETKLVFVANPNNPTGTHFGSHQLEKLLRELPPKVFAVIDEAYVEFADAPDFVSALELRHLRERLIVLRTFSKAYGLAALRVGYAVAQPAVVDYLNRVRAPFNVNAAAQAAAIAALGDGQYVADYVALNAAERAKLTASLTDLGFVVAPSQANFLFVNVGGPGKALYDALLQKGVIVRPMPPPADNWLRITVGLPAENLRLLGALAELRTR